VYSETYTDRKEAMSRERYLKQGKANQELRRLLAGGHPPTSQLDFLDCKKR